MRIFAILLVAPLLGACSYTMNQNASIASVVQSVPLANGKVLDVGYALPQAAAACQLVNVTSRNWAVAQTEGQLKFGGGRQVLQDEAVASVNQRPQDGINYVAFTIPDEADLAAINLTMGKDATTSYYRCATPPQPS
jgi:hypothetical protein